MVFTATFNIISVISWWSVLYVSIYRKRRYSKIEVDVE